MFGDVDFKGKVIKNKSKTNCLIAAHHFSDAPNVWGRLLFDDFYDWIEYLGKLSLKLDYEWYIKFHPLDHKDNLDTKLFLLTNIKNLIWFTAIYLINN